MPNRRDLLRSQLLRALYDIHEAGQENEVLDVFLARFAESRPEWTEEQVLANLRYLALKGWAAALSGRFVGISAEGIDLIEGAAALRAPNVSPDINIAGAEGWTLAGDGEAVREAWTERHRMLGRLLLAIARADAPTHAEKLNLAASLKALRSLMGCEAPPRSAAEAIWRGVGSWLAAASEAGDPPLETKARAKLERSMEEWIAEL